MRRPNRMVLTIDPKSSSSNTMLAASRGEMPKKAGSKVSTSCRKPRLSRPRLQVIAAVAPQGALCLAGFSFGAFVTSHAAERLGSSQSVLSRQLAHMRLAFDDPLLVRQGRGYVLSEQAQALVVPLRQVLGELEALRQPQAFSP